MTTRAWAGGGSWFSHGFGSAYTATVGDAGVGAEAPSEMTAT